MIIKAILQTEKAVRLQEEQNTLTLIVDDKANKKQIKEEVEKKFNVKVEDVRTLNTYTNSGKKLVKKAYVKLKDEYKASDIVKNYGAL
ncbi:MAG TPA: 50S ribosomal protein L23 [Nautiliaceae bacterium]|nr:50S ribosomal protein L23 [Nautiliaceae bacterium]